MRCQAPLPTVPVSSLMIPSHVCYHHHCAPWKRCKETAHMAPGAARGSVVRTLALLRGSPTQPRLTSQRVAARAAGNPLPLCSLFMTETTMVKGQSSPDPSPARPCVWATQVYTGRPSPGRASSPAVYSREDMSQPLCSQSLVTARPWCAREHVCRGCAWETHSIPTQSFTPPLIQQALLCFGFIQGVILSM